MNSIIKLSVVLLLLSTGGCDSAKSAGTSETEESKAVEQNNTDDMVKEGFVVGNIQINRGSSCPYIIIDEKLGLKYDPVNLDEDKFKSFKVEDQKIFFKFTPLRRMNRCNEATPIQLTAIEIRN